MDEPAGTSDRRGDLAVDPRALQILATEHWSLLSARSLAYNEAFTRAGMFLTFVSMSFVGLALLAQATGFTPDFLLITAVVLGFDLVIALVTFMRVGAANLEDTLAMQAMNRIRHAYLEISPGVAPYLTPGTTDDIAGVLRSYGYGDSGPQSVLGNILYGLSTSLGLVALVTAMLVGLLGGVVAIASGAATLGAIAVGAVAGLLALVLLMGFAYRAAMRAQANLEVRFPSTTDERTT
ncbi:MAG: hypothetical protein FJ038_05585 [Chloroflexi bacterium]|nr:hypothetical protein [Chloroflexota bacterium]